MGDIEYVDDFKLGDRYGVRLHSPVGEPPDREVARTNIIPGTIVALPPGCIVIEPDDENLSYIVLSRSYKTYDTYFNRVKTSMAIWAKHTSVGLVADPGYGNTQYIETPDMDKGLKDLLDGKEFGDPDE